MRDTHPVDVAGLHRDFPLFEVAPGVRIAVVNILGHTELVVKSAEVLAQRLAEYEADAIVTAEAKSIPLCYELAKQMDLPWIILRKTVKSYMGDVISAETHSITTGDKQTLHLDEKDRSFVDGKRLIIVDDVISTGSTLEAIRSVVEKAGGAVAVEAAMFTEGDEEKWQHVIALGHLPVFIEE
ncbi:MAG: adenine phosphoribosyltransferase [Chloroflexi bacterium]|nr:adenine phosphoribosyltransferase [Chloroflexota bacterium]